MKKQTMNVWWLAFAGALLLGVGADVARAQIQVQSYPQPVDRDFYGCHGLYVIFKNVTVIPRDEKTATLRFDVTWWNSWRHDVNHDAAWVFFKVRVEGEKEWRHVRLAADKVLNPAGFGQAEGGTPLDAMVPAGEAPATGLGAGGSVGMFLRRADHGPMGTVAATNVTAVWDLTGSKGITKDTKVCVLAFGIKMVYVADGPFYLGSGGSESGSFYQYTDGSQKSLPYAVTNAGAIPTGKQPGRLWARNAEPEDGGEIPASFPNGYSGFYCEYKPTAGSAYAFFLNLLTPEQADAHYHVGGHFFNWCGKVFRKGEAPNYVYDYQTAGPDPRHKMSGGIHWLSWSDGAAFASWAGLRPLTELEFEKSLRGPRAPVRDEAAHSFWGMWFGGGRYRGVARMRTVTVGNPEGRKFKGTHGLGTLALPKDWPQDDAVGAGFRGGVDGYAGVPNLPYAGWCTSCRINAATVDPERNVAYGFRCGRTAPPEARQNTVRGEEEQSPILKGLP
jgi:hypothetical protein